LRSCYKIDRTKYRLASNKKKNQPAVATTTATAQPIVNILVNVGRSDTGNSFFCWDKREFNKIARPAERSAQPRDLVFQKLGSAKSVTIVLNTEFA
jgi:hypothetical protein